MGSIYFVVSCVSHTTAPARSSALASRIIAEGAGITRNGKRGPTGLEEANKAAVDRLD